MNRRTLLNRVALFGGTVFLAACRSRARQTAPSPVTPDAPSAIPTALPSATRATPSATPTPLPTAQPATAFVAPTATQVMTPTPQPTVGDWRGTVALVKTASRAEGVRRAVDLLGANEVRGKQVVLKANYNSADPSPGSTHLDTLRAVIVQLQGMGAGAITLGERSGMGDTRSVLGQMGVFELAEELGFETVVFDELGAGSWQVLRSPGDHWQRGYAMPVMLLDAEAVVQTCNLKTHRFGGHFTLSLKNSVGFAAKQIEGTGYNYMNELHNSPSQRLMIAEVNRAYGPALVVMDGVEAFTTGGPDRGTVVRPEVVMASRDRIALDAVGVAILRLYGTTPEVSAGRVFEQAQIARAVELGLGAQRPQDVAILTGDAASESFAAEIGPLIT